MPISPFSITGERIAAGAAVIGFRGREAISRPYEYEVLLAAPEGSLTAADLRAAVHTRATLRVHRDDGDVRRVVHGVVTSLAFVRTLPGGAWLVRLTLGPALSRLAHARRSRVWVRESVPDVVLSVLRECGLGERDVELRLENPSYYAPVEHLCQYRESHLDFVARRLEAEGLYYHFEHPDGGDAELLVISDSRSFLTPLSQEGVRFTPVGDDDTSAVEGLRTFEYACSATPDGARTRGSDYLSPGLDVAGASLRGESPFVVRELESSRAPRDAARHARVMAEQQAARVAVVRAEGRSYELSAGYSFDFEDHPLLAGEYLATAVTVEGFDLAAHRDLAAHLGFRGEVFHAAVEAIPAAVQFRPERVTPVPTVHGHELGVVHGAARGADPGRYAHLDEHGRYLVRLRFDDHGDKAAPSARMRMAQPHAGANGAGLHMPLRDGTEVLVGFLRGDPDLPYIAAAVPDALTAPPVTRDNATKNVLQTGGGNRLTMEDQEGREYIKLSTPYKSTHLSIGAPHNPAYNFEVASKGSAHVQTEHFDIDVTKHHRTFVAGKAWEQYGTANGRHAELAAPPPTKTHEGTEANTYDDAQYPEVTVRRVVFGDQREDITGDLHVTIHGTHEETIKGEDTSYHLGKNSQAYFLGHRAEMFAGAQEEIYMGSKLEVAAGMRTELALVVALAIRGGLTSELYLGPKLDCHFGFQYAYRMGFQIEKGSVRIDDSEMVMEECEFSLKRAMCTLFL